MLLGCNTKTFFTDLFFFSKFGNFFFFYEHKKFFFNNFCNYLVIKNLYDLLKKFYILIFGPIWSGIALFNFYQS